MKIKKTMAFILVLAAALPLLASCSGGGKAPAVTTDTPTEEPAVSTTEEVTTEETTVEETFSKIPELIEVKWNAGYIGSDSNAYGYEYKINSSGGSYSYTDVIVLEKKGTMVTFLDPKKGSTSSNAFVVSSWAKVGSYWIIDKEGINIPGGGSLVVNANAAGGTSYTYISSKDNECIRFCYRSNTSSVNAKDHPAIYMLRTNEPGTYQPEIDLLEAYDKFMSSEKDRAFYDVLNGITMNVIGDSYFKGEGLKPHYVWPGLIATKYGMKFDNKGIGGSTVSNYVTTNNPMVDRYNKMPDNNPQIVIIEGGRNDYNKSVPIGENSDTSTKTFKGAVNTLIDSVRKKYPDALILAVTVWEVGGKANSAGHMCSDYGRALIEICNLKGVPVYNSMEQDKIGVYMTDPDFRAEFCMKPGDISHLNAYGMMKVMPVFEKWIAEEYSKFKK